MNGVNGVVILEEFDGVSRRKRSNWVTNWCTFVVVVAVFVVVAVVVVVVAVEAVVVLVVAVSRSSGDGTPTC